MRGEYGSESGASSDSDADWSDFNGTDALNFNDLFSEQTFNDKKSLLDHVKEHHELDLLQKRTQWKLGEYGSIKFINYLRDCYRQGKSPDLSGCDHFLEGEQYLKPVLEDDSLLFEFAEEDPEEQSDGNQEQKGSVSELQQRLAQVEQEFENYRAMARQALEARDSSAPSSSKPDNDTHYFESYSYNDIHETMLRDSIRTDAYRDFIYDNKNLFQGKSVLDVGCGTGILSMFCAKAGASMVYAVDNSDVINKARANVVENGLDNNIKCYRGKIEELDLPCDKVDIVISEWMGYALLYESMLDSVIFARDRYLGQDGLMAPSQTNIMMALANTEELVNDKIEFWNEVYGFKMNAMKEKINEEVFIVHLPQETLISDPALVYEMGLQTIEPDQLEFERPFSLSIQTDSPLTAMVIWFDTIFTGPPTSKGKSTRQEPLVTFSTGPGKDSVATHWKQAVLMLDQSKFKPDQILAKDTKVDGTLRMSKSTTNPRELVITVEFSLDSRVRHHQTFHLR